MTRDDANAINFSVLIMNGRAFQVPGPDPGRPGSCPAGPDLDALPMSPNLTRKVNHRRTGHGRDIGPTVNTTRAGRPLSLSCSTLVKGLRRRRASAKGTLDCLFVSSLDK